MLNGRCNNDVKNYFNLHLKKRVACGALSNSYLERNLTLEDLLKETPPEERHTADSHTGDRVAAVGSGYSEEALASDTVTATNTLDGLPPLGAYPGLPVLMMPTAAGGTSPGPSSSAGVKRKMSTDGPMVNLAAEGASGTVAALPMPDHMQLPLMPLGMLPGAPPVTAGSGPYDCRSPVTPHSVNTLGGAGSRGGPSPLGPMGAGLMPDMFTAYGGGYEAQEPVAGRSVKKQRKRGATAPAAKKAAARRVSLPLPPSLEAFSGLMVSGLGLPMPGSPFNHQQPPFSSSMVPSSLNFVPVSETSPHLLNLAALMQQNMFGGSVPISSGLMFTDVHSAAVTPRTPYDGMQQQLCGFGTGDSYLSLFPPHFQHHHQQHSVYKAFHSDGGSVGRSSMASGGTHDGGLAWGGGGASSSGCVGGMDCSRSPLGPPPLPFQQPPSPPLQLKQEQLTALPSSFKYAPTSGFSPEPAPMGAWEREFGEGDELDLPPHDIAMLDDMLRNAAV